MTTPSPSKAGGPPKLTNLYYLRTVATEKTCSMCGKMTHSCLANHDVSDFIYTCNSHLTDPGFARPATSSSSTTTALSAPASPSTTPPASAAVPQSEIDKVKAEYEAKLAAKDKDLAAAAAAKSSSSSWLSTGLKTGYSAVSTLASTTYAAVNAPPSPVQPSTSDVAKAIATNSKVFVLHRSIFAMRQDAAKKKWQAQEAKERAKGLALPNVPKSRP